MASKIKKTIGISIKTPPKIKIAFIFISLWPTDHQINKKRAVQRVARVFFIKILPPTARNVDGKFITITQYIVIKKMVVPIW